MASPRLGPPARAGSWDSSRALRSLVVVALASAALSACTSQPEPSGTPTSSLDAFQLLAQGYIDAAEEQGYTDDQVLVLTTARDTGAVPFESYQAAISATLDCVTNAGIHNEVYPVDDARGFPTIDYFVEGPETGNPVADACIRENSEAVEALYQLQPSSVAAEEERFMKALDQVTPCLAGLGIDFETEGLTPDELWNKLDALSEEEDLPTDGTLGPIRTCMMNAGL